MCPIQPSAISAVREYSSQNWQIELQCPQCGAPLVIEETDRILSCSFCRVRLYIHQKGGGRYYLTPRNAPIEDVVFAPYWRFKGMAFSVDPHGMQERLVDSNLLALRSRGFPYSLGVRPQVLRLRFTTPGLGGKFLSPDFPFEGYCMDQGNTQGIQSGVKGRGASHSKIFIGEMVSRIHSPFLVRNGTLFDAVLNSHVSELPEETLEGLSSSQDLESKVEFIPMLCPGCGWDLEGEKNALVLLCRNCESAWHVAEGSFEGLDYSFLPGDDDASVFLPFWRIHAGITGPRLTSYADLVRFANLPKAIRRGWEDRPIAYWVPAFKIQPQIFLRLARLFTASQSSGDGQKAVPSSTRHAVTLPLAEAVESVKVLIASLAVQKEAIYSILPKTTISREECRLVYFPFVLKGTELIHPAMQMSISVNAVKWGKLL